jgi:Pyruvate/2-oxoacid:ferredoxin oxidoreductase delta subunit
MARPAEPYRFFAFWRPGGARRLEHLVQRVDGLFDRLYSSAYNPLYRTGTLAALCLAVTLVTGVYLLFVYEVGRPYESMRAIQGDLALGRWIRALHRYASDAVVLAVAIHALRVLLQGKTWGPRTLAWVTGLLLTGMTFLSGLTGFVLVWDEFGQKLAVAGARMLRLLPLFPEPPDRSFVGDKPIPSQFFFMNLFLHVAVPLGIIGFLWLHTSRLARAAWFPERRVVWGTLAGLFILSLAWPAPLPPAADLLTIPGRVATDWFYAFWVPVTAAAPAVALSGGAVLGVLLLAAPWWLRPGAPARPAPAWVDPDLCEGCQQCSLDCPYDAIEMVPGNHPELYPLRASILADRCVSCGICAGSCSSLAIGPPDRTARHQLASGRQLASGHVGAEGRTLIVPCRNNGEVSAAAQAHYRADGRTDFFEVDCAGTLHPAAISYLAGHFGGTVVLSCPPQNCLHREGAALADARLLGDRKPAIPGRIARQSVRVLHRSMGEWPLIEAAIEGLRGSAAPSPTSLATPPAVRGLRRLGAIGLSGVLLGLTALGSRWPQGVDPDHALLRLGWRLAGQVDERCRDLTPEELAKRPVHMRGPRECSRTALPYQLRATVDGHVVAEKSVRPPGLRADRPLTVEEDLEVAPGDHEISVVFRPEGAAVHGQVLSFEGRVRFDPKRVVLVTLENERLVLK